jgi:hypothetical protein
MVLLNESKKINKFLYKWKVVKDTLFLENIHNKIGNLNYNSKVLSTEEISNYDYSGNLILFYLVSEMKKLLDANDDKFNSVNISHLLLDMIITFHNENNVDKLMENDNIKRFTYILTLQEYTEITEEITGFYSEYDDPNAEISKEMVRERTDAIEEAEAIDMEDPEKEFEEFEG